MRFFIKPTSAVAVLLLSISVFSSGLNANNVRQVSALSSHCLSGNEAACRKLARIAKEDKNFDARRAAVEELAHQLDVLSGESPRGAELQSVLADIAVQDTDASLRRIAAAKVIAAANLNNQAYVAEIAEQAPDFDIRSAAVGKVTDQSELTKIAVHDSDARIRSAAVEKLTEPSVLSNIAVQDGDPQVRSAAGAKLEDHEWKAAVDPFALAKVEAFLQRHPNGQHATIARQIMDDEKTIGQIVVAGPGSRFVLPNDSVPRFISNSIGVNTDRGLTIIDAINHRAHSEFGKTILGSINAKGINRLDQITMTYNPLMPCGDLSVFVVSGAAENIQGDPSDPIRLMYSEKWGVIYIGGKGKVLSIHNGLVIFQTP